MLAVRLDLPHKDPADRIITASAIAQDATLITADSKILQWEHALKRHNASV
jgi:PIN domain nuclease of toxin-antitoxin system